MIMFTFMDPVSPRRGQNVPLPHLVRAKAQPELFGPYSAKHNGIVLKVLS
jgi:hypothetical protein